MIIGGVEKLTLIDFPGKLSAIIFTQGCNFRCHFCYNPMLVMPIGDIKLRYQKDHSAIPESDLFAFLESRRGKLDAVVVSGGEPTLHADLPEFLAKIKALGYAIKLDSNGTNPEMLEKVLNYVIPVPSVIPGKEHAMPSVIPGERQRGKGIQAENEAKNATAKPGSPIEPGMTKISLVDYFAMDIKAPLNKYEQVVACPVDTDNIVKSIAIIKNSNLPYEFRTTLVPGLHTLEDIDLMGQLIAGADSPREASAKWGGRADKWYLQFFKSDTPLVNREMETKDKFTTAEMEEMAEVGKKYATICGLRG